LQKQVQAGMENQLNVKLVHENNLFKIFEASAARADFLLSHVGKDECFLIVKMGSAVIEIDVKRAFYGKRIASGFPPYDAQPSSDKRIQGHDRDSIRGKRAVYYRDMNDSRYEKRYSVI
jgi:hypothetical protein